MTRLVPLLILTACLVSPAAAAEAPDHAARQSTDAFRHAYAASFYQFDACGDSIAGTIYRKALVARLKQCPFSPAAQQGFLHWATAQRRVSSAAMNKLIEVNGGLPVRLAGMTRTCHEQRESAEYQQVRGRLEAFSAGRLPADAVVTQPCDAAAISP